MGESEEDKRMRAKLESLSGAEKSEFKKNYAMRRRITIDFIRRWAWNGGVISLFWLAFKVIDKILK